MPDAKHEGYQYQDLLTAFSFAELLVNGEGLISVDVKRVSGDIFDDLTIKSKSHIVRKQIKWSASESRHLKLADFTNGGTSIDQLVNSYVAVLKITEPHLTRLSVARTEPEDALMPFLEQADAQASIPGSETTSRRYRLNKIAIWPLDGEPVWQNLKGMDRSAFDLFCENFIVETNVPRMSGSLKDKGQLERLLVDYLKDRVGIGVYPNDNRSAEDFAAQLIHAATSARASGVAVTFDSLVHEVQLRTDFGHVAQRFPIKPEHLVQRVSLQSEVFQSVLKAPLITLVGSPGSGKSWLLTQLAKDLKEKGHLVTRHYCYLEPGDVHMEARITTQVLFGNLIQGLLEEDPDLLKDKEITHAATEDELTRILKAAVTKNPEKRVVLVIDGLDHISRVLGTAKTIAEEDTHIIDALISTKLPDGVTLILGSQPGPHLDIFKGESIELQMLPWEDQEVWALAEKMGLLSALHQIEEDSDAILKTICERVSGNPLYATFLIRGLVFELQQGTILPRDWLEDMPAFAGSLSNYYDFLYGSDTEDHQIPQLLGLLDFGVSKNELADILGATSPDAPFLNRGIRRFQPVLHDVAAQGGIRIFHESFRRYIVDRLKKDGVAMSQAYEPIIAWLLQRDFFQDARSYRYLVSILSNAGRPKDATNLVGYDFISKSLASAQPQNAIEHNVAIAAQIAAQEKDWPALARFSELNRCEHTVFEEHLSDPLTYLKTYQAVYGSKRLAQRLVYDGKPNYSKAVGLILCALIDDSGFTPPWREYVESNAEIGNSQSIGEVIDALTLGRLRLYGIGDIHKWIRRVLKINGDLIDVDLLRAIGQRLTKETIEIEGLLKKTKASPIQRSWIYIGVADYALKNHHYSDAILAAQRAYKLNSNDSALLFVAAEIGFSPPTGTTAVDPSSLDVGLSGERRHVEAAVLESWTQGITILSHLKPDRLGQIENSIPGEGWYQNWLKYVIQITRAERIVVSREDEASKMSALAFDELVKDTRPFAGPVRAVDLVLVRGVINQSLKRGLRLLKTEDDWERATKAIRQVCDGTDATLQKSPSGPIPYGVAIDLLDEHVHIAGVPGLIKDASEKLLTDADKRDGLYIETAELLLSTSRTFAKAGDDLRSKELWLRASEYFGAYGQRKDVTVYELTEGIKFLSRASSEVALDAVCKTWVLCESVIRHTDGRSTKHAINECFRSLAFFSPALALEIVAKSAARDGGEIHWHVEDAMRDGIHAIRKHADPRLLVACELTLRGSFDFENDALGDAKDTCSDLESLLNIDAALAQEMFARYGARMEGDGKKRFASAVHFIEEAGRKMNFKVTTSSSDFEKVEAAFPHNPKADTSTKTPESISVPGKGTTFIELMRWIRLVAAQDLQNDGREINIIISERIAQECQLLCKDDREEDAVRLLRFLSREMRFFDRKGEVLAGIGESLKTENPKLASVALTFAYVFSRGNNGWGSIGGSEHRHWIDQATMLDADTTKRFFAKEIGRMLGNTGYGTGIGPAIIDVITSWNELSQATETWNEMYHVIKHRLPEVAIRNYPLFSPDDIKIDGWSVDEAAAGSLLGRLSHPELGRKKSSILGLSIVMSVLPSSVPKPLTWALTHDGAPTTPKLILQTLWESEAEPYEITKASRQAIELYCGSSDFAERTLATKLLRRALGDDFSPPSFGYPKKNKELLPSETENVRKLGGKAMESLEQLWPEVAKAIAPRFQLLFENTKEHAKDRYRWAVDDRERSFQLKVPVLLWEEEMWDLAMGTSASEVKPYFWSVGAPFDYDEDQLLTLALPQLRLQTALEASRVIRPNVSRPSQTKNQNIVPPTLPHGDSNVGWRRLARVERELVYKDSFHWGDPISTSIIFEGAYCLGRSIQPKGKGDAPFGVGSEEIWLLGKKAVGHEYMFRSFLGPLIAYSRTDDLLGREDVLIPPPEFALKYELSPGGWPGPLVWRNGDGDPMIMYRRWNVGAINHWLGEAPHILEGCELIVHPDLFDKIEKASGTSILYDVDVRNKSFPQTKRDNS